MANGDAHLKNFGLLYESPNKPETIRLSPMYDVVNTKIYSYINRTTGETVKDDELALKLNRSRKYPEKSVLLAFGKECGVVNPNLVIEKIQDAMSESISINKDKVTYQRFEPLASQATLALNATLTPDGAARPRMFRAAFRSAFSRWPHATHTNLYFCSARYNTKHPSYPLRADWVLHPTVLTVGFPPRPFFVISYDG